MKAHCKSCFFLFLITFFFSCLCSASDKDEYCAFEVVVTAPGGEPLRVGVVASQDSHTFATVESDEHGVSRICDPPHSGTVDIHVGGSSCGSVTLTVRPAFYVTRRIPVIFSNCDSDPGLLPLPQWCYYWVRVVGEKGMPIPGVKLESQVPLLLYAKSASDRYGRFFRPVAVGKPLTGVLAKSGYAPEDITLTCERKDATIRDRVVVLRQNK